MIKKVYIVNQNDMILAVFSSKMKAYSLLDRTKEHESKKENPQRIWLQEIVISK